MDNQEILFKEAVNSATDRLEEMSDKVREQGNIRFLNLAILDQFITDIERMILISEQPNSKSLKELLEYEIRIHKSALSHLKQKSADGFS
ncbi:hypothetical protein [Leptospira kmetyi]|uniref:hypothetical protein n=1 Tax=Leptospira kmetyi TaxID=408139 RepID=UPI000F6390B2|nr:hypothetical protein [Leptospira kmetyi]